MTTIIQAEIKRLKHTITDLQSEIGTMKEQLKHLDMYQRLHTEAFLEMQRLQGENALLSHELAQLKMVKTSQ